MITDKAVSAIHSLFEQAIRGNSIPGNDGACVVERISQARREDIDTQRHVVVLTISSYTFRIVTLFDFSRDDATESHMALLSRATENRLSGQALLDAFSELVNMICGAVNRGLSYPFRHVGMSTPFPLESSSARYVSILQPSCILHYAVEVNGAVRFEVMACICTDSETTIDFELANALQDDNSSGEIELF